MTELIMSCSMGMCIGVIPSKDEKNINETNDTKNDTNNDDNDSED